MNQAYNLYLTRALMEASPSAERVASTSRPLLQNLLLPPPPPQLLPPPPRARSQLLSERKCPMVEHEA